MVFLASIYPPVNYCTNEECYSHLKGLKLQKTEQTKAILYILDKGPCPAWVVRFQCEGKEFFSRLWLMDVNVRCMLGCRTAYYNNYFVRNGMRYYYNSDLPEIVQVGEH